MMLSLREQPGQCQLRHAATLPVGNWREGHQQLFDYGEIFRFEARARDAGANIVFAHAGDVAAFAGEELARQR